MNPLICILGCNSRALNWSINVPNWWFCKSLKYVVAVTTSASILKCSSPLMLAATVCVEVGVGVCVVCMCGSVEVGVLCSVWYVWVWRGV